MNRVSSPRLLLITTSKLSDPVIIPLLIVAVLVAARELIATSHIRGSATERWLLLLLTVVIFSDHAALLYEISATVGVGIASGKNVHGFRFSIDLSTAALRQIVIATAQC